MSMPTPDFMPGANPLTRDIAGAILAGSGLLGPPQPPQTRLLEACQESRALRHAGAALRQESRQRRNELRAALATASALVARAQALARAMAQPTG